MADETDLLDIYHQEDNSVRMNLTDVIAEGIEIPTRSVLKQLVGAISSNKRETAELEVKNIECLHFKVDEQMIAIPPRLLFLKIMETIGAKYEPVYKCTSTGDLEYKVCVHFDVSETCFSINKSIQSANVEGEICESPELAERSAVMNAVKYLGQYHFIKVEDYSSSIIRMCDLGTDWNDVGGLEEMISNMTEEWCLSIKLCESFSEHLDYKIIMNVNSHVVTEPTAVYLAMDDFVNGIINRFRCIPVNANSEMLEIKECQFYSGEASTAGGIEKKVHYLQTVVLSEKEVLDCVLCYLGIGKAEYMKARIGGRKWEGQAKFTMPSIIGRRVHKMEIQSKATAHSRSEELAARGLLLFMESKLNMKIVDLNYEKRQDTEKEKAELVFIVDKLLELARHMNKEMGNMLSCIQDGCAVFSADARLMFGGPLSQEQIAAFEFCSSGIKTLRGNFAARYKSSSSMLQIIENTMPRCCGK